MAPSITDLSQHRIQAGESHFVFVHGTGLEHVTAAQVGDTVVDHRVDGTGDNATVTLTIPDDFPPGNHWVVVAAGNERSDTVLIRSQAHNEGAFATNDPVTVTVAPE